MLPRGKKKQQAVKPKTELAKEQNHIWPANYNIHQGVTFLGSEGTANDQLAYPRFHCYTSPVSTVEHRFPFLTASGLNQA